MKNMTLKEISVVCGGIYYGDEESYYKEVSSVTIDSRKVEKGCLFVAIRGARVDGHMFIPQSIHGGALCAVSEKRIENASYPYIMVNSCAQALKDMAEHYRRCLHLKVIGISGSVGKTSTKEMIASVAGQKYKVLKTEGNFNNEIGLPLTIFRIREEHQVAVLEMGISDFGEMERLAKIARPDICVLTNIGCAHLEHLKSKEGILKAKTEMLLFMNRRGSVILNGDDDMLRTFTPANRIEPILFGRDPECAYSVKNVEDLGLKGTSAIFCTPDSEFTAHISVPGEHMIYNALAAVAVGRVLGMKDEEIKQGIEALVPLTGRSNLIETKHFTIIDDCYNANPDSMRASLDILKKSDGHCVAILGDMFELGPAEHEMHYELGKHAAGTGINLLICIGTLAAEIARGAASVNPDMEIYHYETKAEFLEDADSLLKVHDIILVKASHGMEFPEIVEALRVK
ncbi:UDP-N-acetylmuramoyl-tripeptide--D-alanyl-D-alanine ligase [Muricomes intestini]|uniref:UDP-N-acetylmuramoyl-tripeptide--D-alanyl-D- alanine ligase n=1 Tax=Muricomes intestini TaxID=1796634 RepID=UPI000EEA273E|nr:UDP-N-acetylmuramoylalanyl-D-glutamyl-2, 6-diaminopimelate--D-alanyl-D-alanine ligase [Lachnospiraceae bacterium]